MLCCLQANAAKRGDVNGDNNVDVSDINIVINEILGKGGTYNADVNGDGTTDVSDINIVINIILGKDEPEDNHEYVDLGLPSGMLWATCNIGAESPEDYGLYFAWGETVGYAKDESRTFAWANYKWMTPGQSGWQYVTKYTTSDGEKSGCWYDGDTYVGTTVDGVTYKNLTELLPEDDAATANWGSGWRMPTRQEQEDLRNSAYCTWTWKTNYNGSGVNGYEVKSKSNGNSIFLPAAGYRAGASFYFMYSNGYYWSSSLYKSSYHGDRLYFDSGYIGWGGYGRYVGKPVRAVRVKKAKR